MKHWKRPQKSWRPSSHQNQKLSFQLLSQVLCQALFKHLQRRLPCQHTPISSCCLAFFFFLFFCLECSSPRELPPTLHQSLGSNASSVRLTCSDSVSAAKVCPIPLPPPLIPRVFYFFPITLLPSNRLYNLLIGFIAH